MHVKGSALKHHFLSRSLGNITERTVEVGPRGAQEGFVHWRVQLTPLETAWQKYCIQSAMSSSLSALSSREGRSVRITWKEWGRSVVLERRHPPHCSPLGERREVRMDRSAAPMTASPAPIHLPWAVHQPVPFSQLGPHPTSCLPHVDGEQRCDICAVRVLVQDPIAAIWKDERWSAEPAQLCQPHKHGFGHTDTPAQPCAHRGCAAAAGRHNRGFYVSLPGDEMGPPHLWAAKENRPGIFSQTHLSTTKQVFHCSLPRYEVPAL